MFDIQVPSRSRDRSDYSCNEAPTYELTSPRSGNGKPRISSASTKLILQTEKVFDIACAVTDVLPFINVSVSQVELGPVDYLTQVVSLLAKLPGGANKFVPLLIAKVNELRPELVNTLCTATQLPLGAFSDPMSPDTRFVYEEEVGRGLYTDLRRVR